MTIPVRCACGKALKAKEELAGKRVKCPGCGQVTLVPTPVPAAAAETAALPSAPRADAPRPGKTLLPDGRVEEPPDRPAAPAGLVGVSSDYTLHWRDWLRAAREHHTAVLGPMVGYLLLFVPICLVMFVLAQVLIGFFGILFLIPPLAAGPTLVCLAQLKGERWTFGAFFGGFRRYRTWVGLELLGYLVQLAGALPAVVILIVGWMCLDAAHVRIDPADSLLLSLFLDGLALVTAAAVFYLWFRTCLFTRQFIIDRGCGALEAMQGSWRLTRGHFWDLLGVFLLLVGGWAVAGVLTCGVAAILGAPFVLLTLCAGYLHIAGTRRPVSRSAPAAGTGTAAWGRLVPLALLGGLLLLCGLNAYPRCVQWRDRGTVLVQFGFPLKCLYYVPSPPTRDEVELLEVMEYIHESGCDVPLSWYPPGGRPWSANDTSFQYSSLGLVVDLGALFLVGTPLLLLLRKRKVRRAAAAGPSHGPPGPSSLSTSP